MLKLKLRNNLFLEFYWIGLIYRCIYSSSNDFNYKGEKEEDNTIFFIGVNKYVLV